MEALRPYWGWLPVAIAAEVVSMGAFMRMQRRALLQGGITVPIRSALFISYASNAVSITVPFAGGTASTAHTAKHFSSHGADRPWSPGP